MTGQESECLEVGEAGDGIPGPFVSRIDCALNRRWGSHQAG